MDPDVRTRDQMAGGAQDELLEDAALAESTERATSVAPLEPGLHPSYQLVTSYDAGANARDTRRRRLFGLADLTAIMLAFVAAGLAQPGPGNWGDLVLLGALVPLWVVLCKALGLYDRDDNLIHKSTLDELPRLAAAILLVGTVAWMIGPTLSADYEAGRASALAFYMTGFCAQSGLRATARWFVRRSFPPERCLIVGAGFVADVTARKIAAHREYGIKVVGAVELEIGEDGKLQAIAGHGDDREVVGDFESVCRAFEVERVVVAFMYLSDRHLLDLIRTGKRLNVKLTVVPRLFEVIGRSVAIDEVEGMTLLGLRSAHLSLSSRIVKRGMDLVLSSVALVILSPVFAAIAVLIRVTSRGPVLFRQDRIGRDGTPFRIFKFRSMHEGADERKHEVAHLNRHGQESDGVMFKIVDDPRVTRVGRFLRRSSLDELPQLLNVLLGHMSLVGPRPLILEEADQVLGWHRARLDLRPGLTGPWQVLGRSRIPFTEMVRLDYLYVAEWSAWEDVKLILRTVPVILKRSGH